MKDRDILIAELQTSPDALLIIEQIQRAIREEEAKRYEYYELVHEDYKAEFINGEIIFHSPVRKAHWHVSTEMVRQLSNYVREHNLGIVGAEKVMITLSRNDYEPDICFFRREVANQFTDDQLRFPAPDFVVEILSKSTEERDRGVKMRDYAAHGISEYWIVDPQHQTIEQYLLQQQSYHLHLKVTEGHLSSAAIKGFSIDIGKLFA
ncbi:MAG: Uma2 family endonuclease [Bacteroidota bacterium]